MGFPMLVFKLEGVHVPPFIALDDDLDMALTLSAALLWSFLSNKRVLRENKCKE